MNNHLNIHWIETEITSFIFPILSIIFPFISFLSDKVQSTAPIFFSHPNKTTEQESQGRILFQDETFKKSLEQCPVFRYPCQGVQVVSIRWRSYVIIGLVAPAIRRRSYFIIRFVAPAISPNKSKRLHTCMLVFIQTLQRILCVGAIISHVSFLDLFGPIAGVTNPIM